MGGNTFSYLFRYNWRSAITLRWNESLKNGSWNQITNIYIIICKQCIKMYQHQSVNSRNKLCVFVCTYMHCECVCVCVCVNVCVCERERGGGEREREQQQQNSTCVRDVDWSLLKSPWRQFSFFFQFHAEFIRRHLGLPDKLLEVWKIDLLKKKAKRKAHLFNNLLVNILSSKQQGTSHSFPFYWTGISKNHKYTTGTSTSQKF